MFYFARQWINILLLKTFLSLTLYRRHNSSKLTDMPIMLGLLVTMHRVVMPHAPATTTT
ncbi:MAG: hypothetical protein VSS52_002885 [Thiotrichaceae bacterium]|nr:hypothetical protein [Thiotrichaceae bacterium]